MTSQSWIEQAERDIEAAQCLAGNGFHEWACFAAQQSAEKAVKAVRLALGTSIDAIKKHEVADLLAEIPTLHPRPDLRLAQASLLDLHVQRSRYPGLRGMGPSRAVQALAGAGFARRDRDRGRNSHILQAAAPTNSGLLDQLVDLRSANVADDRQARP